jgi:endonuclease/exonuclease/phosphatase family metal-dependent hydrolase
MQGMKNKIIGLIVGVLLQWSLQAQVTVPVMSFNIRLDVASDGDNRWEVRKEKVASLMNYYGADFIGAQEVQHHQLQYLLTQLTNYKYIGVGRDDGKTDGEYSSIFYNSKKYTLLQQRTFWLSPTPAVVSFGWNAACRRICTYGLFRHNATKKILLVANTHFDHISDTARLESAKLICNTILNRISGKYPVILTGDFNSKPDEPPALWMTTYFNNARSISQHPPYGPADTWNAFAFDKKPDGCIDYIFVSKNKNISVSRFATITDSYDMKYPSDHFPILATIEIK